MTIIEELAREFVLAFLGAVERCASRASALLDSQVQAARRRWQEARA